MKRKFYVNYIDFDGDEASIDVEIEGKVNYYTILDAVNEQVAYYRHYIDKVLNWSPCFD